MKTRAWRDQFRVQLWSGFYETTWADYGQYGDPHASRFARPLAGSATLISIDELVLVAQNVRTGAAGSNVVAFPQLAASNDWARPRQPGPVRRRVGQSVVAILVASGMRRARSTERDRVTGIVATTIPPERG